MSTEHADRPRDPAGDDEQLLEWILNPATTAHPVHPEQPAQPAQPVGHAALARMQELEEFLSTCRTALADEQALEEGSAGASEREAALAARVLARTTREDLSWRGDLVLLGGYLRQRLSRSVVLRFAAASLLLHMAALPVLAYYVFLAPAIPDIHFRTIPYEEQYPAPPFPEQAVFPEDLNQSEPLLPLELTEEPSVREQGDDSGDER